MTKTLSRKGTTVSEIVEQLADAIVAGRFQPGERLDEIGLAGRFSVSRTPIREALGQLAAMGLVSRRPNRGAVVAELSSEHLANLIEVMAELEGVCARLAAERMSGKARRKLEADHLRAGQMVRLGQSDLYWAHDTLFHAAIQAGAGNPQLGEMAALARSRLSPFRTDLFAQPARLAQSYKDHEMIVTALLQADEPRAERLMRDHILKKTATRELVG
ncbi:GntR family transcriptional regulator [Pelagibacterium sp. 26DY04]|uniref:GntR family transcriptional regulator n=1 Tax=Pelagibacterium sp. 26DY04 TaxID=2967130 RepID=UPI0028167BD2|nr:GntR family transcriptional regulator [Pelagibacterium sp. 26DY04]WMT86113.1 GntR family transcriptional regulator [Pelagibacterium sp. 26DY04]